MSKTVGCPAPLSMVVCRLNEKQVLIWQTNNSVVMSDGAAIQEISDDIKVYFDENDSRAIPTDRIDDSTAVYDPELKVYKLFISSGSGQTEHNVELEYSLEYGEWTKIYRENGSGANPVQVAFPTLDTDGNPYIYGATNEGKVYRLENGNTWDGTAIEQYVQTKDLVLGGFGKHTVINYVRLGFETKSTESTEDISFTHYCNQVLTVDGSTGQTVPDDMDLANGPHETQDVHLGECLYHSFILTADISSVADGLELTGMNLWYDILDSIIMEE
jgi:hypothetical protein